MLRIAATMAFLVALHSRGLGQHVVENGVPVNGWTATRYWKEYALDGEEAGGTMSEVVVTPTEISGFSEFLETPARFRVSRAALGDPWAKEDGFIEAIQEMIEQLPGRVPGDTSHDQKLSDLAGMSARSGAEWATWLSENRDYLVWSDRKGHFVVDDVAKEAKTPTRKYRAINGWTGSPP